jgi:DNA-binding SARP family transcriptional activator/tetratricopeptide (TPR) repeat protein
MISLSNWAIMPVSEYLILVAGRGPGVSNSVSKAIQVSLTLLGGPEVRLAGATQTFRTRKTLALLIYLAVEGGLHSRGKLATLFWPESDATHSRMMLRRTLAYLRDLFRAATLLDPAEPAEPTPHLLVVGDELGIDSATLDLDLDIVQRAFLLARAPTTRSDDATDEQALALHAAVAHYRGDFLADFGLPDAPTFEEWATIQRESWRQRLGEIFARLAQLQLSRADLSGAVDTARRWVRHDPLDEAAHRALMQAYIASGDRTSALQVYATCQALLKTELNVEPAASTIALAERARLTEVSIENVALRKGEQRPFSNAQRTPDSQCSIPLVGRADELSALIGRYATARRGQPQVVMLEGEAGIGKTRLAVEFLAWAVAQGADVLDGQAFETTSQLPYQPLVDALRRRLERENAPDDLLNDVWLAELSRLLPELRDRYPDLAAPATDEATARPRLFEAVTRLTQALAQRAPIVYIVDDLQWADAASLDLLRYQIRRWAEEQLPVLMLFTLRTEALATDPNLVDWLAGVGRDVPLTRLAPGRLTSADLAQLVARIEGATDAFIEWLFTETLGQPFFIVETLRALRERQITVPSPTHDGRLTVDVAALMRDQPTERSRVPSGIHELIRARLARLSPAAHALLSAGAVLGHQIDFARLCQVAGIDDMTGLSALDEVLHRQLLREVSHPEGLDAGHYAFTHDKIRDVVYAEAGAARRGVFHRRALDVLQAADAPAAELARHAIAARLVEPAFQYSLRAGSAALQVFAVRNAIEQYAQALAAVTGVGGAAERANAAPDDLQQLYSQLGRAYELVGDVEQAHTTYAAMLGAARARMLPIMEVAALNRLATLAAQHSFDLVAANELLLEAVRTAEASDDRVGMAETTWNLAQIAYYAFDPRAALAHGHRGLALARDLERPDLIARSLNVIAHANRMLGQWDASEARRWRRGQSTRRLAIARWRRIAHGSSPMRESAVGSRKRGWKSPAQRAQLA